MLIDDIPENQPLIILSADHLIENVSKFNDKIKNRKYLDNKNIFIFGIKPSSPSDQFGYFKTQKTKNIHKVYQFLEKPNKSKAKEIVKKGGYWNSGMFFVRKDSIINNFTKYQKTFIRILCYQ